MSTRWGRAPTADDIAAIAEAAYATIPAALRRHVDAVAIRVEEFPDEETLAEMGLDSPFDLLGLYRGVALPDKTLGRSAEAVDMIFLYRRPLLDYWCDQDEDLPALIRHVLIHEVGHHFGFSDEDMEAIEREA